MLLYYRLYRRDFRETLRLSGPIIVAQLGVILMGVTDNLMIGRMLGAVSLGAAGIANSVSFLVLSIGIGGMSIVSAFISNAKGQNDPTEIHHLFRAGIRVALLLGVVLGLICLILTWQFQIFQQTPTVTELARPFMVIIALSNIPLLLFVAIRQLCDGLSRPKVTMFITLSALALNALLNYLLISRFGLIGAAVGTLLARIYMAVAIWMYVRRDRFFAPYLSRPINPSALRPLMTQILRMGLPGGFQFFFEIAAFSLAVIMIGWLGEAQLAAHQIAINLAATTYMMATGIAAAGSIRVAMARGQGQAQGIAQAGTAAILLVTVFMGVCCAFFLTANDWLVGLYIRDNREVAQIAAGLILIAAFFQLSDGIQVVALGALRGISDVNIPTLITLIAYWVIALPMSYVLAFPMKMDVTGVWIGLSVGLAVSALLLTIRFYRNLRRLRTSSVAGTLETVPSV